MVDERLLARAVALVHAADLRDRLVRLVDEDDVVGGEVVEQRVRRRARRPPVEDPRVVLDPVAEAELAHHLQVVLGALADPVRLEHPALALEERHLLLELVLDLVLRALDRRLRGDVLRRREDGDRVELREDLAGERVEVRDLLDLVAEHRDPVGGLGVRRLDLDHVALDPEAAAAEQRVVADVLDVDQLPQHHVAVGLLADGEEDDALLVLLRRAEAVDAGDGGDDDRVAALEQVRGRRVAEPVDVVVPRASPSRCRGRPAGRTPPAGSSRSRRRSTRPRSCGKNSRNSLQSCAASVLLCAITSAGRCSCSMIQAIVAVLPVPVAPSRVW